MKRIFINVVKGLLAVLPAITMFSIIISANTTASPIWGQPTPPIDFRKYRKF